MEYETGKSYDQLQINDQASFSKTITETDVYLFAGITGDFNPLHVNEAYARKTPFKARVKEKIEEKNGSACPLHGRIRRAILWPRARRWSSHRSKNKDTGHQRLGGAALWQNFRSISVRLTP